MAGAAGAAMAGAQDAPIPILDTHIHLYDPTRPHGTPYPPGPNPQPALPDRYRIEASPLGITGGIRPRRARGRDNSGSWTCADHPFVVGVIGNLDPMKPEFLEYLDRYRRNKLYLGIRYGNIWHHDLVAAVKSADFIANMKRFAATGLTYEAANPRSI